MSRRCEICGKGMISGNNVSHANNKTRRQFKANIQKIRTLDEKGTVKRMSVCTRCIRSGRVTKVPAQTFQPKAAE